MFAPRQPVFLRWNKQIIIISLQIDNEKPCNLFWKSACLRKRQGRVNVSCVYVPLSHFAHTRFHINPMKMKDNGSTQECESELKTKWKQAATDQLFWLTGHMFNCISILWGFKYMCAWSCVKVWLELSPCWTSCDGRAVTSVHVWVRVFVCTFLCWCQDVLNLNFRGKSCGKASKSRKQCCWFLFLGWFLSQTEHELSFIKFTFCCFCYFSTEQTPKYS